MDKKLNIGMRYAAYSLPSGCPRCLPIYCYCVMAGIPFESHLDFDFFDLDFSPKITCNQYISAHGIEDLVKKNVANLDYSLPKIASDTSMALHALIRYWLGNAVTYELWVQSEISDYSLPKKLYFPTFPLPRCNLENKIRRAEEKLGLIGLEDDRRAKKIDEIYGRARKVYDSLSTTLGEKCTFFGDSPTSLDATFLGHALFTLHVLPDASRLKKELQQHTNLLYHASHHGEKIMDHGQKMMDSVQWPLAGIDGSLCKLPPRESTNWTMKGVGPRRFDFHQVKYFTKDFTEDQKISEGAFGEVFKGRVIDTSQYGSEVFTGLMVAVKAAHNIRKQEQKEWEREVKYLSRLKHPHVLKLWGHSSDGSKLCLVYEFMENGSVSQRLNDLDWSQTRKIAIGSAAAMEFLHNQNPAIVFSDFRAPNILLDRDFYPKLGDFGQAKQQFERSSCYIYGYHDPEAACNGLAVRETDIYSMGILLLQLMTKEINPTRDNQFIQDRVRQSMQNGDPVVHKKLVETKCTTAHANTVIQLAFNCVDPDPNARPNIAQVVQILETLRG